MAAADSLVLSRVNPLVKLGVCLAWLVAAILIFDPAFQAATIAAVVVVLIALNRTSPGAILLLMVPFALVGVGILTTNLLFHRVGPIGTVPTGGTLFALPSVAAGVTLFLRSIACGLISALFVLSTDPGSFVRALMAYCRLPARMGYALFAVMQLVPDLAAEAQQMRLAAAMKSGRPPRVVPGPREAFGLMIPLLAYAIRRAGRAAIAMEARGLSPGPRTIAGVPPLTGSDGVFVLAAIALIALCAAIG